MYEFSVARKYLIPRVRQLSVSCISLISVLVIAAVVWLSIVFFSAQEGIEKKWTEKLIALTAHIRLTPMPEYYQSYYYEIDSYSARSQYTHKTLRDKLTSISASPYDPNVDSSLPIGFPKSEAKDIVKETNSVLFSIDGLTPSIFETAYATITVDLAKTDYRITQAAYVVNYDPLNPLLHISLKEKVATSIPDDGIILPKSFQEAGVAVGDRATLAAQGFGAVSPAQVHLKAKVVGFYDPGIIPIGGKVVLAAEPLLDTLIHATIGEERILPTGFNVYAHDLANVQAAKEKIQALLDQKGLAKYWKIETFNEFEFTKDIFQQMKSDRNLFSLISFIIIIVASSNIVSMLIILVHDKKKEIAILQALGATKKSISLIFGFSGFCMGAVGACIGIILAFFTLKNLQTLLGFLGKIQGHEVLNQAFYGDSLPSELSLSAALFVLSVCALSSTIAGMIAAISAARVNTSEALKNE